MRKIPSSLIYSSPGPEAFFTGRVWMEMLVHNDLIDVHAYRVTFEPSARTAWHTHPAGQILIATSGNGLLQKEGESVRRMQAGDTIVIPSNEKHWHGAAPDSIMQHFAIQPTTPKGDTTWLEHVFEADFLTFSPGLFEPTLQDIGEAMQAAPSEDQSSITIKNFRSADAKSIALFGSAEAIDSVTQIEIEGPSGAMNSRVYRPNAAESETLLVYFHGGGFVRGSLDTHHAMLSFLANRSKTDILSVAWPLAPENKFPTAVYAAAAALRWVAETQSAKRLIIAGDSAGGNIAVSAALAVEETIRQKLAGLVLIHPMLDATVSSSSSRLFAEGFGLTRTSLKWAWSQYLPPGTPVNDPLASPVFCSPKSLAVLPRTLVIQAELDPARDDGERFAALLRQAGVPVQLSRYPGVMHNFALMINTADSARAALDEIGQFINSSKSPGE